MFEWDNDYKIGIADMDGEHLVLFSLLNQLEVNINSEKADECVQDVLSALLSYVGFHFENERRLMEKAGYPGLEAHLVEHENFVAKVRDMQAGAAPSLTRALQLRQFVLDWLLAHILGSDAAYARFVLDGAP
jgi:hemerythrin-like metal-binding protein